MWRGLLAIGLVLVLAMRAQAGDTPPPQNPQFLPLVVDPKPTPTNTATATVTRTNTPTATNTATATNTPTLPPPSFNNCQLDPTTAGDYPVSITAIEKGQETVTLKNVSNVPIDLTNWTMCSVLANQQHPIFGVLQPGQSITFPGPPANIWNNAEDDDGALYNNQGQLVSFFDDGVDVNEP
jgi:hypothetical protein